MASQLSHSNSTAPIPMQPPIPTTNKPPIPSIAPLPNPNNPSSNINNTPPTQHTTQAINIVNIPPTTNLSLIPKQTTLPSNPISTISTISSALTADSSHSAITKTTHNSNMHSSPNPNDKDSRRLKGRNHRNISTPSHKLLTLHHKPINDMTGNDIRKYLQDVPCELLSDCLIELCVNNNEIFNEFDNYALIDPTKIRIFIRGLNYDTDKETLSKAFQRFGTVVDATVIYDKTNNRSKGYGFITFSTSVEAAAACRHGQLEVDSRRTQISLATPLRNKSFGDRDRERGGDRRSNTDTDYRHRNRRSRSRSRSRDRDKRRHSGTYMHKRGDNKRRGERNNSRFNRSERRGDRRSSNRGRFGANHRHKSSRGLGRGGGYGQGGVGRGGYMAHDTRHNVANVNVAPPTPMVYGGFNYGYDTSAYAAAYNPAGYNPASYNVGVGAAANTNVAATVNAAAANVNVAGSGMVQPQYNGNLYAQQYAGYNPYFAGK